MMTLDVRNAFNSVPWESVLEAGRQKRVPGWLLKMLESYMSERAIEVFSSAGGTSFRRVVSCGVPQGSVLGPDLWNLVYDGLCHTMPAGVELIAFADDVAIVSTALVPVLLEETLGEAFQLIND